MMCLCRIWCALCFAGSKGKDGKVLCSIANPNSIIIFILSNGLHWMISCQDCVQSKLSIVSINGNHTVSFSGSSCKVRWSVEVGYVEINLIFSEVKNKRTWCTALHLYWYSQVNSEKSQLQLHLRKVSRWINSELNQAIFKLSIQHL